MSERVVGILAGILLVRLLSKEDYGTFLQVSLIGTLCTTTILMGLPQSLLYFLPQLQVRARKSLIVRTSLLVGGASLVVGIVLGLASPLLIHLMNNPALGPLRLAIVGYTLLFSLDRLIDPVFIGLNEARRAGILALAASCLMLPATLIPAWMGVGVAGIYGCILVVYLLRLVYFGSSVARLPGAARESLPEDASIGRQMAFSVPLGLAGITGQYNRQLDGVAVSAYFAPAVYAVYARGAFQLPVIDLLPYTLSTVILPRLVELWRSDRRTELIALFSRTVKISALVVFPAFAYAMLFADDIIVLLFTESYRAAVPVFRIYLLALPLRLASYGVILQAMGDTRTILRSSLFGIGLNLGLALALCPILGPPGAAAAYVASEMLQITYLVDAIRRRTSISLAHVMPWRNLAAEGAVVVAAGAAAVLAGLYTQTIVIRLAITGVVFASLCAAGDIVFKLLSPEEKELLRRWSGMALAPRGGRSRAAATNTGAHDEAGDT